MNRIHFVAAVFALSLTIASGAASAEDFDGSKPLVCASIHATECGAEAQECRSGAPWMINFPVFTQIDFKGKKISTTRQHETPRVSEIEQVDTMSNGHLTIQGKDGDFVWSMMIAEDSGAMTLSVAGEHVGFVVFGACTVNK